MLCASLLDLQQLNDWLEDWGSGHVQGRTVKSRGEASNNERMVNLATQRESQILMTLLSLNH